MFHLPEQQQKDYDGEADGRKHHGDHGQGRGPVVALRALLHRQHDELTSSSRIACVAPGDGTENDSRLILWWIRGPGDGAQMDFEILTHRPRYGCAACIGRCRECRNLYTSSGKDSSSVPFPSPSSFPFFSSSELPGFLSPGW